MTVSRLGGVPAAQVFADIDPDQLSATLREALCDAARNVAGAEPLSPRLRRLVDGDVSAEAEAALLTAVARDMAMLDVPAEPIGDLIARVRPPAAAPAPVAAAPASDTGRPVALASVPSAPPAPVEATGESLAAQTIRVDVDALEHLMTVASELVLIRNQLLQLLRLDPESPFAAPLHRLNQVTSELQEGVMTTRMQPISGAWAKLPRLVRGLANDLGKRIDLVMEGQTTELDRQVLELIKDPLTHMIRNAADHGLETPAERLAAGKPAVGRISLSARHEGGAIVVEMADDGRGMSAARIRAKAMSQGLITGQQSEAMSDAEARRLIFHPGFSTAETVTAVSGRGVGMDVVRTNIEKIGGVIDLTSTEGAGSRFSIRIPLTLTIISALIVECCGERFAMPQSSVVELVSAGATGRAIEYIDGAAVLRLRDRLLPLVSLQTLLGLPAEAVRPEETCIVVARVGAFTYGVIVDRVFDTEEIVVKPVSSVLRHLKAYSGATILGDGSVIMILDFKGMSPDAGVSQGATTADEDAAAAATAHEALLVFRAGDALKATRLAEVSRIEEAADGQIERVDGRSVIQYRGRLMAVVGPDGRPVAPPEAGDGQRPLLVFARDDQTIGVLVDEIVDIVETVVATDLAASGEAAAGSLIVNGQATELIDVGYFWRASGGPTPAAAAPEGRRLLVVDDSPFCRALLQPLLARAGYTATVVATPDHALALHDAGQVFDLILADTGVRGAAAQSFRAAFLRATAWHTTPLIGLGLASPGDAGAVLAAVADNLDPPQEAAA